MKGQAKIWCLAIATIMVFLTNSPKVAASFIIGTWGHLSPGIYTYYPNTGERLLEYNQVPDGDTPSGDIAAFPLRFGVATAEVITCWRSGLWIYDYVFNAWSKVNSYTPKRVTVGELVLDERPEIIATYGTGIYFFYWEGSGWAWRRITSYVPTGDIAAGDIDGDGLDEVVVGFSTGTWYWNPAYDRWTQITSSKAYNLAVGDRDGDGQPEVVGAFPSGIWSWDRGSWIRLSLLATKGDIALGDFDHNFKDDLAVIYPDWPNKWPILFKGRMYILWDSDEWKFNRFYPPYRITAVRAF